MRPAGEGGSSRGAGPSGPSAGFAPSCERCPGGKGDGANEGVVEVEDERCPPSVAGERRREQRRRGRGRRRGARGGGGRGVVVVVVVVVKVKVAPPRLPVLFEGDDGRGAARREAREEVEVGRCVLGLGV